MHDLEKILKNMHDRYQNGAGKTDTTSVCPQAAIKENARCIEAKGRGSPPGIAMRFFCLNGGGAC